MSFMNWFGPKQEAMPPALCPRCKCDHAERKGSLERPTHMPEGQRCGTIYGCTACGLLYAVTARECYALGEKRAQYVTPPLVANPAGGASNGDEPARPIRDPDMNWDRKRA